MYDKCSLRGKRLLAFTERAREHAKGGGLLDPLVCSRPRNFSLRPKRPFPSLCIKTRLSAQPLIRKWLFILMQIKLIFTRKVVHFASFWKWRFMELGNAPPPTTFQASCILFVCHTLLLKPYQIDRLSFSISKDSWERPVAGRPRCSSEPPWSKHYFLRLLKT